MDVYNIESESHLRVKHIWRHPILIKMKIHQWHWMIAPCWVLHPCAPSWAFHRGPASSETVRSSFGPWWNKWWRRNCWFQPETTGKRYGGDGLAKKTCKIHFSCCQSWVGNCRNFPIFVQAVWFAVSFNVICCNNHDVRCWKEANVPTQTGYQPMVTIGQSSRLVVHLSCLADIFFWSCLKHWAKPPKQKISY